MCPRLNRIEFNPSLIDGVEFKLLLGDASGTVGNYCPALKLKQYQMGVNSTRWHMMSAHTLDLHEVDDNLYPTPKKDLMHVYDDESLLVFREIDRLVGS